jgi:hypothetical protein
MEHKTALEVEWKLHTVMSDRGIRTATELHRRIEPYGIQITSHQLSRIVSSMPARLNTALFKVLLTELQCEPNDLFRLVEPAKPAEAVIDPRARKSGTTPRVAKPREKKTPQPPTVPDAVLGPNITPMIRNPTKE